MNKNFIELCEERYSVRSFDAKKVEEEKIASILRAAQVAPTAGNRQPVRIYVIKSDEAIETLQKCKTQHFGETLAFIVCYDSSVCWVRDYDGKSSGDVDASIVATHMMLEAQEQGIGSTWIMHFIPEAVRTEFELPDNIVPVSILVMGYPSESVAPSQMHTNRRDISDITVIR